MLAQYLCKAEKVTLVLTYIKTDQNEEDLRVVVVLYVWCI